MSIAVLQSPPVPVSLHYPPRTIYDENGQITGVILAYADYRTFLHFLARQADWEQLPPYLQDAIDHRLADEAEAEAGEPRPLRELLAETGDIP
ncbi:MAG: hypothetical protein HY784_04755 [Chloroflexi bacterium]|nr:hypothetical protein [Chloroflexota bacterium]